MNSQLANMNGAVMSFGAMFGITVYRDDEQGFTCWQIRPTDLICITIIDQGDYNGRPEWDVQLFTESAMLAQYKGFHDYIQVMRTVGTLALPHLPIEIG